MMSRDGLRVDPHGLRAPAVAAAGLLALIGPGATPTLAQDDATCAVCHTNPDFFQGQPNPSRLIVRPAMVARSVHGAAGFGCTTCHGAMAFPHAEDRAPVQCGSCHIEGEQHRRSLHGQAAARGDPLAPSCATCHGIHAVKSHTDPTSRTAVMNIPTLCGECHHEGTEVSLQRNIPQDRILENYSQSIHGEGLFRQGLTVTAVCTSCHTSHNILPHTDRRSSIHHENVAATCTQCHALIEQVHLQVIEGRLWEERPDVIPACVDCHAPHRIRRVFYDTGAANQDCMRCHGDAGLVGLANGDSVSLYVDEVAYGAGAHGETACAQCHDDVTPGLSPATRACATATASSVDCSVCHEDQSDEYGAGMHGQLAAQGDPDAPVCLDCHAKHATLDHESPESPTYPRNVPDLCARCHRPGEAAAVRIGEEVLNPVESYGMSIHGKGLIESGLVVTATCSNCHTAHRELPASDSLSSIHPDNVAGTCGTCHHGIEEEFATSIHAIRRAEGETERELPTCEDCHTSHTISRTDLDDFRLTMMTQCGRCHVDESETFFDTFHGKVSRLGEAGAAKCYDCHGTHNILQPTEPASMLSRRNIIETCSQCHAGVNRRFTGYLTHATHHDPDRYPFLFWTFWAMTALLIGTLSFAILHTLAWLFRLSRSAEKWKVRHVVRPGEKVYQRFTVFQRTLHIVMLLSFFMLALTGMALKFSHMVWAQVFADLLGGFAVTGVLHRIGAIALIVVFGIHLRELRRQKRRRETTWWQFLTDPDSLVFNRNDLRELWGSIKWFMGRAERPHYGRYTYWEKFDYFAVFWGMMVIGSTGLLLWFPELFTVLLPGWTVNVATIIHSDEALLAVAFIFTVHFFNTHFRLDKFPMDPVIFTGHVPVDELKRDKPREYEELVESGTLENKLVEAYPRKLEKAFKIFGMTALAIGVTLILLIVYSMLFGYR
jgi:cytochrome b subunit of formate dehydrogenase